jgi:hypothetical protein
MDSTVICVVADFVAALLALPVTVSTPDFVGVPETVQVTTADGASDVAPAVLQTAALSPMSVAPEIVQVAPSAKIVPVLVQVKDNVLSATPLLTVCAVGATTVSVVVVFGGGAADTVTVKLFFTVATALLAEAESS